MKLANIQNNFNKFTNHFYQVTVSNNNEDNIITTNAKLLRYSLIILIFFVFGFLIWACIAPINSAAIAIGNVNVIDNKKIIQHLEGGIIAEIYVEEGQEVKAGQNLMKLSQEIILANIDQLETQLFSAELNYHRLTQENNKSQEFNIPQNLLDKAQNNNNFNNILVTQINLFENRKEVFISKMSLFANKIDQLNSESAGLSKQISSIYKQISIANEEIQMSEKLASTGHGNKTKLLNLQSKLASLEGDHGELITRKAKISQMISETLLEKIEYEQSYLQEIIAQMKDHQVRITELSDKIYSSQDFLKRTTITAPVDGYINGLKYHTIGGVISPGTEIMEIIPNHNNLQIEAKISPQDIDIVYVNMPVKIRLTAYKMREVVPINGTINHISADNFQNSNGQDYYVVYVTIDQEELKKMPHVKLQPGMPVELLLINGSRTFFEYLIYPIKSAMFKSFRAD